MNIESVQAVVDSLKSFKNLKHGWCDGQGHTYNPDHIDWLISSIETSMGEIECPFVYPSLGRNCVRLEFDTGFHSVDVEVDLEFRSARVINMSDGKSSPAGDVELSFSDPQTSINSWKKLGEMVRSSRRISQEKTIQNEKLQ